MALSCSVSWLFAVEIVVQSSKQNPRLKPLGSEGLALAGIHKDMILK